MEAKVVVHHLDGRLVKGVTRDFLPAKPSFNVQDKETGENIPIEITDLKAVFFVKTYRGNPVAVHRQDTERVGLGKKIKVVFKDSETLVGYTSGYSPGRPGFFVFPADPEDNNEKVFVVTGATNEVSFV